MEQNLILKQAKLELCRRDFLDFVTHTKENYQVSWHHKLIADILTGFVKSTPEKPLFWPGTTRPYKKRLMIFVQPQSGKFLPASTPIFTPDGWKTHGELKYGDYVFGQDGKSKMVLSNSGIYNWSVSNIEFNDGQVIEASPEHLWKLKVDYDNRKGRVEEIKQTKDIFNKWQHRAPYIDCAPALEMPEKELPINPYVLGCWLGDGRKVYGALTTGGQDLEHFSQLGRHTEVKPNIFRINVEGLTTKLRLNKLLRNKHIPDEYFTASISQREALLQGLMDTDGFVCKRTGRCEFTQKSGVLAEDTYILIRSLGYKASKKHSDMKLYGRVVGRKTRIFFSPDKTDNVFMLPRKTEILRSKKQADRDDKKKFFIRKIYGDRIESGNCIQVEGGMYLAGIDMIPTHNSELVSRRLAPWALGLDNRMKIALISYSSTKAEEFSADMQRIMDCKAYRDVFPDTRLADSFLKDTPRHKKRTNELFEIYGHNNEDVDGFVKAVGIRGPLTGTATDLIIIDDPIKDDIDAASDRNRETNWQWYDKVAETRIHNETKIILTMTRWHHDDLAGRLLDAEGEDWDVLILPALKENNNEPLDPRSIGDALWPERHSKERMIKKQAKSPRTFVSLFQQRPTPEEGAIIQSNWLTEMKEADLPKNLVWDMWIDGAYTKKTEYDPSGFMITAFKMGKIYIRHFESQYMEMPELLKYVPVLASRFGVNSRRSMIHIEPKASGKSLAQMLRDRTNLNVREIKGRSLNMDKIERVKSATPTIEGGRVFIVEGGWTQPFYDELTMFPFGKHDEAPDLLSYAVHRYYVLKRGRGIKIRN